jgi:uncharacterized coiled-coil protein SlyX
MFAQRTISRKGHKHSVGLDRYYVRIPVKKMLVQWSKAINNLTIDSAYHSNKRLEIVEGETNQKIAEQSQKIEQQVQMIGELKMQLDKVTRKMEDRDRRRMGFFDAELKSVHVD